MKKLIFVGAACFFSVFTVATTSSRKILANKSESTISYAMSHPMHSWEGECNDVAAVIVYDDTKKQIEQVAVVARVDCFDSGNSNRDSHAIEVLEGLKYPKITFISNEILTEGNQLSVKGNLTFHGITKSIRFKVNKTEKDNKIIVDGFFNTLLTVYEIERPSLLGIETDDNVNVKFKIVFNLK